jgi:hypothetical protein
MKDFRITQGQGFQLVFPNKVCASVQWGVVNYCENRSLTPDASGKELRQLTTEGFWDSNDAEVMAWVEDDNASADDRNSITRKLYPDTRDVVIARMNVTEVMEFLTKCANYKP